MPTTNPPFRADMVGSLLRTPALKDARAKHDKGALTAEALRSVEDDEIGRIVRKQEAAGLQLATDGEFRRSWWHFDFFWHLTGCERVVLDHGIQFHGIQTKPESVRVTGKIDFPADHPMLAHFKFLKASTKVTPKMTIPSPSVLHFRGGRNAVSKQAYPSLDAYFDDLAKTWGKAIKAFYAAGCRYLQFDDTVWAYLCSKDQLEQARARGEDADKLAGIYARIINTALKEKPADMVITTHVCRGNFRSTWISEGGYEPIADLLLGGVDYDGYFLEYDTERAGGLRAVALPAQGQQAGGRRPGHLQERHAREEGRPQAAARRGLEACGPRPALPLAPVRLCLHRGGQRADGGAAVGQARHDRRPLARGVEVGARLCSPHCFSQWGEGNGDKSWLQ